jgi:uncharacterized protein YoxC
MAAIVQKNIPLIITLITFVFSVGIIFAKLEYTIRTVDELEADVIRIDKETATILKDLHYIKEGITEIKSKLK